MGWLQRLWRVVRANINSLIGRAEDPEKILEQAVADMQQDLVRLRQAVAQAIASQKRTERQASQARSQAQEWHRRAQLALEKGDENLAREALQRRKTHQDNAQALEQQLQQQNQVVDRLKRNMRQLEGKISQARTQKDLYIARARSAQASQKIAELTDDLSTGSALNAFERMEDKVNELEASAQAAQELSGDELDKRFSRLEQGEAVESELSQLRAGQSSGELPAGEQPAVGDAEVERELERLRSQRDR
jgi:phage shock protein A